MSGGAKSKAATPPGQHAPARARAPARSAAEAKPAAPAKAGAAKPSGAPKRAKTPARTLPIRSSPVSTTPSLRSKLSNLKTPAKPAARAQAPVRSKAKLPPFARNPVLQELEPRLLMSADLNPLSGDALTATPALAGAEFRNIADTGTPTIVTTGAVAPIQRTNELVFVDTAVPEYRKLIDEMRDSALAEGRNLEFVLIEQGKDGVRKITDTLARKSDLDAVHIVSHGDAGALQLGAATLDFDALVKRASAIKKWGNALTENGDILIYGCDLAATQEGRSLVDALARLTGADVAASEDPTGSAAKGGDWDLEFRTGTVETAVAVAQAEWQGTLATYTVTNTNDAGGGSLRDAIAQANANAGADAIDFAIGGAGVQTINLATALPQITGQVFLDGWSQGGGAYSGPPLVEINGAAVVPTAGTPDAGLHLTAGSDGSTVRGFIINGFTGSGDWNDSSGIFIETSNSNAIVGNWLGTDATGTADPAVNQLYGILLAGSSDNTIGGLTAAERNVISGNDTDGVRLVTSDNNLIVGNWIGLNKDGNGTVGNSVEGIYLRNGSDNNTIGGTAPGAANVIGGNAGGGIRIGGSGAADPVNNVVQGNYLGTDPTLALNFGSGYNAIEIDGGASNNLIGGVNPGEGNYLWYSLDDAIEVYDTANHSTGNAFLGNSIYAADTDGGGDGNGIDLVAAGDSDLTYGATANDANDADALLGSPNELQNFPALALAVTDGTQIGIRGSLASVGNTNYRIEFFSSAGTDPNGYREGATFLGAAHVTTDSAGNVTFNVAFAGNVPLGRYITATATRANAAFTQFFETSEFSLDDEIVVAGSVIAGTVFEDVDGDANVGEAGTQRVAGATVRLFQDNATVGTPDVIGTDTLLQTVTTDASGNYAFIGLGNGNYWVAVDSKTIAPSAGYNAGFTIANVWAEQTYGDDSTTAGAPDLGARYGGRSGAGFDNSLAANTAEHLSRVNVSGGTSVTGVDYGFSFNVVTNTDGDNVDDDGTKAGVQQQGSLRQFIANANAITGANDMRFVPAVATNAAGGGGTWWRVTVLTALSPITDAFTTIDGTAYSAADGVTVLDEVNNPGFLNAAATVGVDGIALAPVERPELEIVDGAAANVIGVGLDVAAANVAIRDLAIYGFGDITGLPIIITANIRAQGEAYDGLVITGNVIGTGAGAFTDPGALARSEHHGIFIDDADDGTIQGNLIGFTGFSGVDLRGAHDNWLVEGNEIRGAGRTDATNDGVNILNGSNVTVQGNLITQNLGPGVDINRDMDGASVVNNTITNNATGAGAEQAGVRVFRADGGNVVDRNVISGNTGAGVLVATNNAVDATSVLVTGNVISANTAAGVLVNEPAGSARAEITQNRISANGGLAIDLNNNPGGTPLGDGVTANDAGDADPGPNNLQNFPVITSTTVGAGTVVISGTLQSTSGGSFHFEFFGNDLFQTGGYYEAQRYLGSIDVTDGGPGDTNLAAGVIGFTTPAFAMAPTDVVTATATNVATLETSELSPMGVLIVDTTADTLGGDTSSISALIANKGGDNRISLREAILATNNTSNNGTPDRILFNIPDPLGANGAHTIQIAYDGPDAGSSADALPQITEAVIIDGWSEPDHVAGGNPVIELDGQLTPGLVHGLDFQAGSDGSTVRGLVINRFGSDGIMLRSSGNLVVGNYIGTDVTGTAKLGNRDDGVDISGNNNTIGGTAAADRNIISGNDYDGIAIDSGTSTGNLIIGNYIGVDRTGAVDLGNGDVGGASQGSGVHLRSPANLNTIGGTAAGAGNVISGNFQYGVYIETGPVDGFGVPLPGNNVVLGNYIGTNATGTAAIGNGYGGVRVNTLSNTIGGAAAGAGNLISGNTGNGIYLFGGDSNLVYNNLVGTNAAGTGPLGNTSSGIVLRTNGADGAQNNVIGGVGLGNLVGFNQNGISLEGVGTTGNVIQGNWIGTDSTGTANLGNAEEGVEVYNGAANNTIGLTLAGAGAGNRIANNGGVAWDGVWIGGGPTPSTGNSILGNAIYANGALGIDLGNDGVTPNDVNDVDTGANDLQNTPVLYAANVNGANLTVYGGLNSVNATTFRIEFFATSGGVSRYLGTTNITTAGNNAAINYTIVGAGVLPGELITATATNTTALNSNTSEFSASVVANNLTVSGTVRNDVNANANVADDGGAVFASATVRLYVDDGDGAIDAGDLFVGSALTNGSGQYSFANLGDATYWVTVDSKTLEAPAYNGGFTINNVWAEQTYGDDWNTAGIDLGARYGGRNAASSDNAAALVTAEHVARAVVAGANLTGVDAGFSFSAIVNTRGDTTDDDAGAARMQQGSLRQFILNANAIAGVQTSNFSINYAGGGGQQTIQIATVLPIVTDAIVLDGTTQEGYGSTPLIELDGSLTPGAPAFNMGIEIGATGGGSTVRALAINGFGSDGININLGANGNLIENNYLGVRTDGTTGLGNRDDGIDVNSRNNVIRNNLSSANLDDGVVLNGPLAGPPGDAAANVVYGNRLGTNAAGTAALGNGDSGVEIRNGANANTIGGTTAAERNLISGNFGNGVRILNDAGTVNNVVLGNYIGTNAAGTAALGNRADGVLVRGNSNTIGGSVAGAGNVISGNRDSGIQLAGGATGNLVLGNYVGTNFDGTAAVSNNTDGDTDGDGIRLMNANGNTIGGTTALERNVVSGNDSGIVAPFSWEHGIYLWDSDNNLIQGNYIGTNAAGTSALRNFADGIGMDGSAGGGYSNGNIVRNNLISGNKEYGIWAGAGSGGQIIQGNLIGTNFDGTTFVRNGIGATSTPNPGAGIRLDSTANTVGGTVAGQGNVISGNLGAGIALADPLGDGSSLADSNVIQGNYIGTTANGLAALANAGPGVDIGAGAANNTIGGTAPGARNVISGNTGDGVRIFGSGATGNRVEGNYIGTDVNGTGDLGNSLNGVWIFAASGNTVGGGLAAAGNVISGNNRYGVEIGGGAASGNVVQANRIGTTADGTGPLGNTSAGVSVGGGASNNVIGLGYSAPNETGLGNTIAYNGGDGVEVTFPAGTQGNRIAGNAIYLNGSTGADIGIDLGANGNGALSGSMPDAGDGDAGPNGYQNYPEFTGTALNPTGAMTNGTTLTVNARLLTNNSIQTFRLHFYANPGPDATGDIEGQRYLGYWDLVNPAAFQLFTATVTASVADGEYITMTATRIAGGVSDTSEFSGAVQARSTQTIGGTIYNDDEGDGAVGGDAGFVGATVKLYRDNGSGSPDGADTFMATATTGAGGTYSFANVVSGYTYWVVVDSKTLDAASIAGTVWADQTYGDDSTTALLDVAARYGGRNAAISDNAWDGSNVLQTPEHVSRVVLGAADENGVDYGFSFVSVTNDRGDATDDDEPITAGTARLHQGSLRQVILNANAIAGTQTVNFSVGTGQVTINASGGGYTIDGTLILDGTSQEGFSGTPLVLIDGNNIGGSGLTLTTNADNSRITGLIVRDFGGPGIDILAGSDNNVLYRNYVGGLDFAGNDATLPEGNAGGIRVAGSNNTIGSTTLAERNVISRNTGDGLAIVGGNANIVIGNYFGTNAAGNAAAANTDEGVQVTRAASGNPTNTRIGGTNAGEGNLISANLGGGIEILRSGVLPNGSGAVVQGNRIGTDAAGSGALGNGGAGIRVEAFDAVTIGGTVAGAGNVIANNVGRGVEMNSLMNEQVEILGNSIFLSGNTNVLGIDYGGGGVTANDPGNPDALPQNFPTIAGVRLVGATVEVDFTLDSDASQNYRVEFFSNLPSDAIGPFFYYEGRSYLGAVTIATNASGLYTGTAVLTPAVLPALGDRITGTATNTATHRTSEFTTVSGMVAIPPVNTVPGAQSVAEDTVLAFSGANTISVADSDGNLATTQLTVTNGVLNVTLAGGASISAGANGSATLTISGTQAAINATLASLTYQGTLNFNGADTLTVLSTDATSGTDSDAVAITVTPVNDAPAIANLNGDALAYTEGAAATVIDQGVAATVTDVDSANFDTGTLTVSFTAGSDPAEDVLAIRNQGVGPGQIGVSGANVTYGGVTIGTFAGGSGGANLVITFNANATPAAAQALLQNITYANTDTGAPTTGARTVQFVLTDGDGGTSAAANATVTVSGVNDAPTITNGATVALTGTDEDTTSGGTLVSTILAGAAWADADAGALQGIAVTGVTGLGGWQYSTDGLTWNGFGAVSGVSALLLDGNTQVRYVPNLQNGETATFSFRAWDQTTGTASTNAVRQLANPGAGGGTTAYSSQSASASIAVASVNDAPTLNGAASPALAAVAEDAPAPVGAVGTLVSALIDFTGGGGLDNTTDVDTGAVTGIAITATNSANGTWHYSTNGGASWNAVGAVADGSALLLNADASTRLYFQPNANFNGTVADGITFRAWDRSAGVAGTTADTTTNGGTTPFSTATDIAAITVTSVNDAPVADAVGASGAEDAASIAITLTGTDVDGTVANFRLTNLPANGTLYLDAGLTTPAATATNYAAAANARTFYFVPNGNWNGATSFQYTAIDNLGLADASDATATITVTAVNDAPANAVPGAQTVASGATLVFSSGNGNQISVADIDAGATIQVQLNAAGGTVTLNGTAGLTFSLGDGTADATMAFTGTIAAINTALNGLGYAPSAGFVGAGSLQIVTDDLGGTGAPGPLSDSDTIAITVTGFDISGTIVHDIDGDANVAEELPTSRFAGATVRLFADDGDGVIDAGDTLVATTVTNGAGLYSFTNQAAGTYWVTADSTTLTAGAAFNAGYDASWLWAEQTYGDDSNTAGLDLGARFGGRDANTSDNAGAASPVGSEHVARVDLAGANQSGVNYGFSFNAIVTTDDGDDVGGNRTVQGSLRQFIINSNAIDNLSFGVQSSDFSIAGGGVHTISLADPDGIGPLYGELTITDAVVLDATTQDGFAGTPLIEIEGTLSGSNSYALRLDADNSQIRGLLINRFSQAGIRVTGDSNVIAGNWIGVDATGNGDLGNGSDGVVLVAGANLNTIGGTTAADRNVVAGNADEGVSLDGATNTLVVGNYIGVGADGVTVIGNDGDGVAIQFGATGNTIGGTAPGSGNVIAGNAGPGIGGLANVRIKDAGTTGNVVLGNYIGVDLTGSFALASPRDGVRVDNGATDNTIGGSVAAAKNVISGNSGYGVLITDPATSGTVVLGNYIGTNAAGTAAIANGYGGVRVGSGSNTIGGTVAGAGNLISGNAGNTVDGDPFNNGYGVVLAGAGATGNLVAGNTIGLDAGGTVDLGNAGAGVFLDVGANGNTIGGTAGAASRNVISGAGVPLAAQTGLVIRSDNNVVLGNYIGTDRTGALDVGNSWHGIEISGANNTVGGTTANERNVISGNDNAGVEISGAGATGNRIQGNFIGVAADGTTALGNTWHGVNIITGAANNMIGGAANGAGNVIANSQATHGVQVRDDAGAGNSILGNSIYGNAILGINLRGGVQDGFEVTQNDAGDADGGANNLQNYPVLASAISTSTQVAVGGTLDSITGATFRLEFFANAAQDPLTPHGEGQRYLGFVAVTDGGAGDLDGIANGSITFSATVTAAVTPGEFLTATATNTATNDTSEFSANVAIVAARVSIVANDAAAGEPANNGQFTVSLSAVSSTDTVVSYAVGGSATAGADYTALTGSVTILAGQLSALIDVTVMNDVVVEGNETVTVTLNSITSGDPQISIGAANTDTVTVADDGDTAQVSIVANDAAAGEPANNGQFTVSLSAPSSTDTVISYTIGGSATAGADYTALTGSVTILAGQLSALIDVTVMNDIVFEGNETVTVTLNSITSGDPDISISAASTDTVTIADDDLAPINTVPGPQAVPEDVLTAIPGVSVMDPDANLSTVALAVGNGTLSVTLQGGATISAGANGTGTLTLSGSQADINATLATLGYQGNPDFNGADTLTVTSTDAGGGVDTDAVAITVTAVNDTPANTVPGPQAATEDTALGIGGISVNDVDGNLSTVALAVGNGTLNVTLQGAASISAGGNGSGALTLSGSQADINATLATLVYQGNLNFNGADTLSVTSTDSNGAFDADNVVINVAAVNDVPANTVPGPQVVNEDTALPVAGISVTDVDGNLSTVALAVASGTLNVTLQGAASISAGANGSGTVTLSGAEADINATLATLVYQGNLDFNGADALTVTTTDSNGAFDTDNVAITVTAVNDAPVATVPGAQLVNEDTLLPIGGVSVNDVDGNLSTVALAVGNGTLSVTLQGAASISAGANGTGALTLSGTQADINATLATLGYQGNLNFNGADALTVTATDSNGALDAENVAITVTAVNDTPVNTVPGAQAATEDVALPIGGISVADPEGNVTSVTLAVGNGTLDVTTAGAAGVAGDGTGTVTITGTQADINATLASLVYQGNPGFNGADTLVVTSTDSNGATDVDPVAINVAAVNDLPANTVPGPQVVNEDTPLPIGGISVTDVDGNLSTVALAVASGTLNVALQGAASISAGANGSATLTLSGTEADINATLATLVYQGNPDFNGADTLTVTSTDTNGAFDTDNVAITVTGVNDTPVNVVPGAQAATEDTPLPIGGISVTDVEGNVTSVTLAVGNGTLTVTAAGAAGVAGNGSGTVTITGTQADINATLASLGYLGNPNFNGADTLTVTSTDSNGAIDTDNVTINVAAVNDAPANTVPGAQTVAEDTPLAIGGISVNDVDANIASLTLAVGNGTLNVVAAGAAGVAGNGTGTVTITGSQADINATAASLVYQGNADFNGLDTLTVTATDSNGATDVDPVAITVTAVNDTPVTTVPGAQVAAEDTLLPIGGVAVNDVDGNIANVTLTVANGTLTVIPAGAAGVAGNGTGAITITGSQADINATLASLGYLGNPNFNGADTLTVTTTDSNGASSSGNVPIAVAAVNDAPVNTVPGPQAATEDTPLAIGGISVNDVDANIASLTLAVGNGTLNVVVAGAAGVAGNGTGTVTITGSQADINATAASLVYQGNPDFNGADTLTVTATDGNGATDVDPVAITVTAVNDTPVTTVPGAQVATEDTALPIGGVSVNDVDGNIASVTLAVGNGTLNVVAAGAAGVAGNGTGTVTITGSQADINATLASLGYQGNANFNGADTLTVTSTDTNGASSAGNVPITVTAVNDAPVNTVPGPQAGAEDTWLAIGGITVNDPDGGPVTVTLGVATGTLSVSLAGGATITGGANGSATVQLSGTTAQVNAALATLGYLGPANWSGADTLTVTTSDGVLVDADNIAITLAAVNDNPVLGANSFAIGAGGTLVLSSANLSATDVETSIGSLVFSVGAMANGRFELVSNPGVGITSFTQADIQAGLVRFVHDGSGGAPAFSIYVSDGGAQVGPFAANISFTGGGGFVVTPPPTGSGGSGGGVPTFLPAPVPGTPGGSSAAGATAFLRGPTEPPSGGADTDETPVEQPGPGVVARAQSGTVQQGKVLIPDSQLPGIRVEAESIETKPLRSEIQVAPMRAEMEVLPVAGEEPLDLEEEDRQRIEIVLNSVRITGLAMSVGAVWWAARAAGLLASLLTTTPAWRHVDPLPVLGRADDEEEEADVNEEDKDRRDDEHRARWVLDERAADAR